MRASMSQQALSVLPCVYCKDAPTVDERPAPLCRCQGIYGCGHSNVEFGGYPLVCVHGTLRVCFVCEDKGTLDEASCAECAGVFEAEFMAAVGSLYFCRDCA